MQILSKEEIQNVLLDIMQYFHDICEKNNIYYVLCSGSCLGAVRHKGFIPWDDDIDVFVPRSHYEKLINILKDYGVRYVPLTYELSDKYYYPFCKLIDANTIANQEEFNPIANMGLYIDIFPVDGLPADAKNRGKHINVVRKFSKLIAIKNAVHTANPIKNLIKRIIGSFYNNQKLCKKINALAVKYPEETSEFAMDIVWGTKPFLYSDVSARILVPFEDRWFYIPENYDNYLKTIYGDYMQLPPEDKRVTHGLKAYMTEKVK